MLAVVLSSPNAVNASLGSTATFTCTAQQADFLNWFINGSLNAEHTPFNGVQRVLSQNSTVIAKELQLEATLMLNHSEVSCLAGNIQAQLVSSSRARLLVQGVDNTLIVIGALKFVGLCVCIYLLQVSWLAWVTSLLSRFYHLHQFCSAGHLLTLWTMFPYLAIMSLQLEYIVEESLTLPTMELTPH